jgi:hypothetical protein
MSPDFARVSLPPNIWPPLRFRLAEKDKARLLQFIESGALDPNQFQTILTRHGLQAAWQHFEKQFLASNS